MTSHQRRHLFVQFLRRAVQVGVVVAMIAVVYLSLYSHYREARALEDLERIPGLNGRVLTAMDRAISTMSDPSDLLNGLTGTIWSMRVAGVNLTDPLAAAETVAATRAVHMPLLISIIIPVVITLLLGRVFCSWVCPAGLLFDLTDKLRGLLRLAEIKPGSICFSHRNKYVLLLIGLVTATILGLPFFSRIYPPAVLGRVTHALIFGTFTTGMLLTLGVIAAFEIAVSPRWWCRTMCPGGALYGLFGSRRLVRIKLNTGRCSGCRECEPVCPMGLNPVRDSAGMECDNCGLCLRHCPDDALLYSLSISARARSSPQSPGVRNVSSALAASLRRARSARPTTAAAPRMRHILLAFACLLLTPFPANAHHILGLPHYSYKDNYPQVPTLEYPATTGPYDVLMTCYPGRPTPGDAVNIAFYIKDRTDDAPYAQPVRIRVLQTFTFGRNREILPQTIVQTFDKTHKVMVTFPEDGEFVVELTLEVEGQTEVIPFLMIAGEPTAATSALSAIGTGLILFIVIVRAIKIKRDRRVSRRCTKMEPGSAVPAT